VEALEARVLLSAVDLGDVGQFASPMTLYHGAYYFTAGDGIHGDELWKTDGTAAGTKLVKEINPNISTAATISSLTVLGDKLLFGANNGTDGPQLWVSDGTAAGTMALAGTVAPTLGFDRPLSIVNGEAYYTLQQGADFSLWKTNGTSAGTVNVSALPGNGANGFTNPFLIGNRLYLVARTLGNGSLPFHALYSFNISNNSVTTVIPFSEQKTISNLTDANGVAYYYTGSIGHPGLDLEHYDPVGGRVHVVQTVSNVASSTNHPEIAYLNGSVYFTADDAGNKSRLWVTDGAAAGSHVVDPTSTRPINLTVAGGRLYYFAQDSATMFHLFTLEGVTPVDLAQVPPSSDMYKVAADLNGRLLFVGIGNDGNATLWVSNGTAAGTRQADTLGAIAPPNPSRTFLYDIREMQILNNTAIIRSRPDSLRYHLYGEDLAGLVNHLPTGSLDDRAGQVIVTGRATDSDTPNQGIKVQVMIDGNPNTTLVTAADGTFTWYVPPLNFDSHPLEFFAVDSWTGEKVMIGSRTFIGDGLLFDDRWYLNAYPDVAAAVKSGAVSSGLDHFLNAGDAEGRNPNAFFNTAFYLDKNPDVEAAVKAGTIRSGWDHFRAVGMKEQRDPSPFFNTVFYLQRYPDIAAKVATGEITAFQQFFFTGQFERRTTTPYFEQNSYLLANPDVTAVVSTGSMSSALQHFITEGQTENRHYVSLLPFNESAYLTRYPDVKAAVADGRFRSGLEHFLWTGKAEGRIPT
jgi:ELWxxDGT repeat protein